MKQRRLNHAAGLMIGLSAILTGCSDSSQHEGLDRKPTAIQTDPIFYTVGRYDESRDPTADLAATINRAQTEQKRILLHIGGDWCIWCARISEFMQANDAVRQLLEQNFLVMKVAYPTDRSETFLAAYPEIDVYPHFLVLEKDGTLLHSQPTEQLETGDSYSEQQFVKFLSSWSP